jgi:hypothetical protein
MVTAVVHDGEVRSLTPSGESRKGYVLTPILDDSCEAEKLRLN